MGCEENKLGKWVLIVCFLPEKVRKEKYRDSEKKRKKRKKGCAHLHTQTHTQSWSIDNEQRTHSDTGVSKEVEISFYFTAPAYNRWS